MTEHLPSHSVLAEMDLPQNCPQVMPETDSVQCSQVEAALQESEAFNRSVFEGSADCIKVLDLDGCLLSMNASGMGLMEIEDCTPLIGTAWAEFWQDSDRATASQAVQTAKAGDNSRFSGYCPTAKGTPKWWDVVVTPILDVLGKPKQLLVISRDISDRKRIEAERNQIEADLRASEARLRFMLNASRIGEWDLDLTTEPYTAHRSLRHDQIFGYESLLPEWSYEIFLTHVHPDDRAAVNEKFQQTLSASTAWNFECRIIHLDQSVHWIWVRSSVYCNHDGTPTRLLGMVEDITEAKRNEVVRKQAEIALQNSEEQFRNLADHAPFMVWATDPSGYCTYLSQSWYDFTGQTPETGLGFGWLDRTHPDNRADAERMFLEANQQHQSFRLEYRLQNKHGEYIWAIDAASPWFGVDGKFKGYIGSVIDITDRKQAEVALQESEAQLRLALKTGKLGSWQLDLKTNQLFTSDQCKANYGFSSEADFTHQALFDRIHPDDQAWVQAAVEQAIEQQTDYDVEYRTVWDDGSIHGALVRGCTVYDADRTPLQMVGMSLDITDRKQAEAALQESEEQSRNILESITDGFFALNQDWRFTYVNPQAERLLNRTPGDLLDKVIWEEYPATVGMEFERAYRQTACERVASSFISFYPDHNCWYEVHAYPAADGITVYFRNVTEQIQAEAALRESKDRLRLALESAELGTWDFNPATGVLRWDEQCKAMFGLSPQAEVNYETFLSGLHPDDRDRTDQVVQTSLNPESGGEYDIEYRTIGIEDGVERWIAAKGKAFFNPAGLAIRFIGTVLNMTEQKRAAAEQEHLLHREQTARETAERANRVKDEFLAVLSHELRSPLNPILGWARLLRSGKLDPIRAAEALATIERNAKLQSQLIDDLLDISRIMQGKLALNAAPVSLAFVISSAIETVQLAAEAKSISIEVHLEPNMEQVYGDAGRLQQVVWNLLSNAVKFTPTGGRVDVRLTQVNRQARLQVIDTGKGIRSEFLPYVFEHFRQEDGATTRKFGGLGLGLAIASQIVELHGGRIWVESLGEDQGATFTVELPCFQTMNPVEAVTDPILVQANDLPLANLRVLIVDDEPDSREFVAFVVEQAGAEVTAVSSATEALQRLSTTSFDLLLSDIGMPEMDGYELMRQISQSSQPGDPVPTLAQPGSLPALALTAYAGEINQRQALTAGFQGHITKPVEPDELIKAIVTLMDRNGGA